MALVARSILNSLSLNRLYPVLASTVVRLPTSHQHSRNVHRLDWRFGYAWNSFSCVKSFHISAIYHVQIQGSQSEKVKSEEQSQSQVESHSTASTTPPIKPSIFQKFKQMYKEYWYVLIPVHCITSVFWAGGFYFAVKNGLDVVALLENLGVSEKIINPLRNSSVGYYALTYAMYKVASPARYAVTIGGTTVSINYLTQWGYIKPVPTSQKLQDMYETRKAEFDVRRDAFRRKLKQHRADLKKRMTFSKKKVKK